MPNDRLVIGKIVGIHGVRGALKMVSFTENPTPFRNGDPIRLTLESGREVEHRIAWIKPHKKGLLLALETVTDPDQALELVGGQVLIDKSDLPALAPDEYYWTDLIGLSVQTVQGEFLGQLTAVLPTGSNDVYVVENQGREVLIPALQQVVREVDLANKVMRVDLPEGLDR